jgi:hypothetical protein
MKPPRWTVVSPSAYEWEREALEFLREHLPDHEPWRAWSNFEFVDDEGRVNEVDLLVLSPAGLLLVEVKSRPGTIDGDALSWVWTTDGRPHTVDNPLLLANRKAKRLASLLKRQDAFGRGASRVRGSPRSSSFLGFGRRHVSTPAPRVGFSCKAARAVRPTPASSPR